MLCRVARSLLDVEGIFSGEKEAGMVEKRPIGQRSTEWHEAKARATKAAVVAGAARVFDRVGYRNAVVSAISKESGTTAGAMYHYYASKEEVALAVVDELKTKLFPMFAPVDGVTPLEQLIDIVARLGGLILNDPLTRAGMKLALEPGALQAQPIDFVERWISSTAEVVRRAQASGEVDPGHDPEGVARLLITSFIGTVTLADIAPDRSGLTADLRSGLMTTLTAVVSEEQVTRVRELLDSLFQQELISA